MCTLGDAAANGKGIGSIGDGPAESWRPQVGALGGLLAFLPMLRRVDIMRTPALLIDGI